MFYQDISTHTTINILSCDRFDALFVFVLNCKNMSAVFKSSSFCVKTSSVSCVISCSYVAVVNKYWLFTLVAFIVGYV